MGRESWESVACDVATAPPITVELSLYNQLENKAKTMTDKERKKAIKEIERRLKEHKKKNTLSDAEMWELQDKVAELKNEQA